MSGVELSDELERKIHEAVEELRHWHHFEIKRIEILRAFAREILKEPHQHAHNDAIGTAAERLARLKLRAPRSWSECCMDVPTVEVDSLLASQSREKELRDELEKARAKNAALNRRCQSAESGLAAKLDGVPSFGRALANAGAFMWKAQLDAALAFIRDERERHYTPNPGLPYRGAWCKGCDDAWPCDTVVEIDALIGGEDWPAIEAAYRSSESGRKLTSLESVDNPITDTDGRGEGKT